MSVDDVLVKALRFLEARGLKVDLSGGEARKLVDTFRRGAEGGRQLSRTTLTRRTPPSTPTLRRLNQ
ncbi:MAG: hypothetical protein KIH01_03125 [Candidatus Freyarchaeota archaeon]|nr:hypothetical protein [Candidatus Jordarchaeia archaeon]